VIAFTESLREAHSECDDKGGLGTNITRYSARPIEGCALATRLRRERAVDEEKLRREKKKGGKKRLQRLLFLNTKGGNNLYYLINRYSFM
jgi:hypothetical protein